MKIPICPRCGSDLCLCSWGAWNCPECFEFIRMGTKEEIESRNRKVKTLLIKLSMKGKQIRKCKICGEPYWEYPNKNSEEGYCPDCVAKADAKEARNRRRFGDNN